MRKDRTISTFLAGWIINTHVYSDIGPRLSSLTALKSLANKNNGEVVQIDRQTRSVQWTVRFLPRNYSLRLKCTNVPPALSCKMYRGKKISACHAHRQRYGLNSVVAGSNPGHVIAHLYRLFRGFLNISEAVPWNMPRRLSQRLFFAIYSQLLWHSHLITAITNISAVWVWSTGRFLSFLDKVKICGEDALQDVTDVERRHGSHLLLVSCKICRKCVTNNSMFNCTSYWDPSVFNCTT
jgi:hypothetical protein